MCPVQASSPRRAPTLFACRPRSRKTGLARRSPRPRLESSSSGRITPLTTVSTHVPTCTSVVSGRNGPARATTLRFSPLRIDTPCLARARLGSNRRLAGGASSLARGLGGSKPETIGQAGSRNTRPVVSLDVLPTDVVNAVIGGRPPILSCDTGLLGRGADSVGVTRSVVVALKPSRRGFEARPPHFRATP